MLRKKKSLLGLDVGSHEIKAIELTEARESIRLTAFGRAPLHSPDDAPQVLSGLLRECGIKTKRVAISVSGKSVIVRYINMPVMTDEEMKSALKFEADKYIPFEIDEVVLDCVRLDKIAETEGEDGAREMKVLLVAVKQTLIDEQIQLVQGAGLMPVLIDVDTFAVGNAFEFHNLHSPRVEDDDRVVALVDVGAEKTSINILRNNVSYFSREVYLAGNGFTEAIARRLGMDTAEADAFKRNPEDKADTLEECILPTLDDLANEIHLSLDYYENQYDREVDEVYLSGGSSLAPGLQGAFERVFNRRVSFWDPTENIEIRADKVDADELKHHSCQLAVATGLAARISDV